MGVFKPGHTYIAQKAFVFRRDGTFLTMRRTKTAPAHPLTWDLPGGNTEFGEDPFRSMEREILEETGLSVKNLAPFDVEAHVSANGIYWFTVMYVASEPHGTFAVSWEHDLFQWVTLEEFLKLKSSKRLRWFAERLLAQRGKTKTVAKRSGKSQKKKLKK